MKISEIITDKYKLRIPPTVYYDLLADVVEIEEQEPKFIAKSDGTIEQIKKCNDCLFKEEWEKIGKLLSVVLEKQTEQEPRKGHWGWLRCDMYVCSECKNVYTDLSGIKDGMNYCPNCGSDNREVEE